MASPIVPAYDVAQKLVGISEGAHAGLVYGTDLFVGPVRPASSNIPPRAVFCLPTGGPAPETAFGGTPSAIGTRASHFGHVQVRVRSDPGDWAGGYALSQFCRDRLNNQPITNSNSFGGVDYIDNFVLESEPNYLGTDPQGCHEFSINVELWYDGNGVNG